MQAKPEVQKTWSGATDAVGVAGVPGPCRVSVVWGEWRLGALRDSLLLPVPAHLQVAQEIVIAAPVLKIQLSTSIAIHNFDISHHERRILLLASHRSTQTLQIRQSPPSSLAFDCLFAVYHDTCYHCFSTGFCWIDHFHRQPYQGFRPTRKGSLVAHNTTRRGPITDALP